MQDHEPVPDPAFRAWVAFMIPANLLFLLLGAGLFALLQYTWESLGIDPVRAADGSRLIALLLWLPVSFWCFRRALRRHVYPYDAVRTALAGEEPMRTAGSRGRS